MPRSRPSKAAVQGRCCWLLFLVVGTDFCWLLPRCRLLVFFIKPKLLNVKSSVTALLYARALVGSGQEGDNGLDGGGGGWWTLARGGLRRSR